ncbi:hypothetical protein JCM8547_001858 [Rhodosporidiobolus lusitaniae]
MVYYVCPNCGTRSDEYGASMVHYNACDVVRVRNVSSPTNTTLTSGQQGASSGAGGAAGQVGGAGQHGGHGGQATTRPGQMGVLREQTQPPARGEPVEEKKKEGHEEDKKE